MKTKLKIGLTIFITLIVIVFTINHLSRYTLVEEMNGIPVGTKLKMVKPNQFGYKIVSAPNRIKYAVVTVDGKERNGLLLNFDEEFSVANGLLICSCSYNGYELSTDVDGDYPQALYFFDDNQMAQVSEQDIKGVLIEYGYR